MMRPILSVLTWALCVYCIVQLFTKWSVVVFESYEKEDVHLITLAVLTSLCLMAAGLVIFLGSYERISKRFLKGRKK